MFNECRHIMSSGAKCHAPALSGNPCCYFHTNLQHATKRRGKYDDWSIKLPPLEDNCSLQIALAEVLNGLASSRLDPRRAGLMLYGIQIAARIIARPRDPGLSPVRTICEATDDVCLGPEKIVCEPPEDCRACPRRETCEDPGKSEEEEDENHCDRREVARSEEGCEDREVVLRSDKQAGEEDSKDQLDASGSFGVLLHELSGCQDDHRATRDRQDHSVEPQPAQPNPRKPNGKRHRKQQKQVPVNRRQKNQSDSARAENLISPLRNGCMVHAPNSRKAAALRRCLTSAISDHGSSLSRFFHAGKSATEASGRVLDFSSLQ
jgi:hypothetical protein